MNPFKFFSRKYALSLGVVALMFPVAGYAAAPISFTTASILKAGVAAINSTITSLMVKGSILANGGNFVCNSITNPNCGFVYGVQGINIPAYAKDTGTGGLAKYDTNIAASPFNSSASARGLKTGTGVVTYLQYNVISNPKGVNIDCSKVAATKTGTGGTALVTDASATGSTVTYSTPFVMGPTEYIKCGSLGTPGASFSGTLLFLSTYSEVVN